MGCKSWGVNSAGLVLNGHQTLRKVFCLQVVYDDEHELNALRPEDSDSEDDDASSYHDELESSEEESEKVKDRELEWDDSTLTFWVRRGSERGKEGAEMHL